MKSIVLALCFVALANAAARPLRLVRSPQQYYVTPQQQYIDTLKPKQIAILSQTSNFNPDGNFNYDFQSENGISEQTVGTIKVLDPEHQAQVIQGHYTYTSPEGTPIDATWFADETGFHIEGAHLPTPPPIPEAIAKSLEYLRTLPPQKDEIYEEPKLYKL